VNNRILVTYATRAGSTFEVATAIGETLAARNFLVDIKPIKENPRVERYEAVLMGSAVRMGKWLPEAVDFVKTNRVALNHVPVALFTIHMKNTGDDEQSIASRKAYLNAVRPLLKPVPEVFFAGKIDQAGLSFIERLTVRIVKSPVGDFRDWDEIRRWAQAFVADAK
jgi:menaquinone-dependent protoporphyrinogen oxidase